ncbi:MAG TPA: hypothetical protein VGC64_00190, partial [Pyrinomonadaceae bacterium]
MKFRLNLTGAFCCVLLLASSALAQQTTPLPSPSPTPSSSPSPSPAPKSDAAQRSAGAPDAKKMNERPASAIRKAEPFDGATIERMAAQCVVLETEAGAIELEMLAEA